MEDNDCNTFNYENKRRTIPISQGKFDPKKDIFGRSIGGTDTSFTIPKLSVTLDAGPSISELEPENNVFISHTDHDHFNGLKSLMCMSIPRKDPYDVYISEKARDEVEKFQDEMSKNIGIKVNFNYVKEGDIIPVDDDTKYEFFPVIHADTSIGISIQKKQGEKWSRELTYTGDISLDNMKKGGLIEKTPQLWDTKTLIIESSILSFMEWMMPIIDSQRGNHSSIDDVDWLIDHGDNGKPADIDNVVLVHVLGLPQFPPLIVGCGDIKHDLEKKFNDNNINSYYLTSCRNFINLENDLMYPVEVTENKPLI